MLTPEQQVMFQSPERSSTGQSNPRPNNELGSITSEARIACRRTCTIKTVPPFLRAPCRNICEDSPPALEACAHGAAGGDPVMGARQLSGSLADLWPETANPLARSAGRGLENDHSRTRNALAQWCSTGVVQARCAPSTRPPHSQVLTQLPVDFLLVKKVTLDTNGY